VLWLPDLTDEHFWNLLNRLNQLTDRANVAEELRVAGSLDMLAPSEDPGVLISVISANPSVEEIRAASLLLASRNQRIRFIVEVPTGTTMSDRVRQLLDTAASRFEGRLSYTLVSPLETAVAVKKAIAEESRNLYKNLTAELKKDYRVDRLQNYYTVVMYGDDVTDLSDEVISARLLKTQVDNANVQDRVGRTLVGALYSRVAPEVVRIHELGRIIDFSTVPPTLTSAGLRGLIHSLWQEQVFAEYIGHQA